MRRWPKLACTRTSSAIDRKSTRLNSSHTDIYTLSLHDALPISVKSVNFRSGYGTGDIALEFDAALAKTGLHADLERDRSEEHPSQLQSHRYIHSFPTRRSSDLREKCQLSLRLRHGRHRARVRCGAGQNWLARGPRAR